MAAAYDFLRRSDRVILEEPNGVFYNHSARANYGLVLTQNKLFCFQRGFAGVCKVFLELPLQQIMVYEERPLIRVIYREGEITDLVITTENGNETFTFQRPEDESEPLCRRWKAGIKTQMTILNIQQDAQQMDDHGRFGFFGRQKSDDQSSSGQTSYGEQQGMYGEPSQPDPFIPPNSNPNRNSGMQGTSRPVTPPYTDVVLNSNGIHCPKCGSTAVQVKNKGFGLGKAAVGAMFLGPFGLFAGMIGSKDKICKCAICNYDFKLDKYLK